MSAIIANTRWVLVWVALCLISQPVWANGFRNPPESAAAAGQAGGRTALIDNPSAISHNPANLTRLESFELMETFTFIYGETEYVDPLGLRRGKTDNPWKFLANFYGAGPLDDRIAIGFGITTPFGQATEWKEDGPFQFLSPHLAELTLLNFNPTLAYQATDRLSIGAVLNIYYADLTLEQRFPWSQVTGVPGTPFGNAEFEGDGTAAGGTIGLSYDLTERQRLGFTYRSEATVTFDGDFKVSNVPPLPSPANLVITGSDSFNSEITFPNILALGYGIQLTDALTLGADVEWLEFSSFQEFPLDIGGHNPLLPAPSIPQKWDDTWTFSVGLDWAASDTINLLIGYAFLESPVPEQTLAPTLPDADRHYFSAGIGFHSGRHELDLAYAYSLYDDLDIRNNVNPAYNGSYDINNHLFEISYNLAF